MQPSGNLFLETTVASKHHLLFGQPTALHRAGRGLFIYYSSESKVDIILEILKKQYAVSAAFFPGRVI